MQKNALYCAFFISANSLFYLRYSLLFGITKYTFRGGSIFIPAEKLAHYEVFCLALYKESGCQARIDRSTMGIN